VAYLLKVRIEEPEKYPLLRNGCVTRNNGMTVGSSVFCAVRAEAIKQGPYTITEEYPCGGGVEYLHRDPASRRRRQNGKSQM
jgi:hypothetical protein